MPFQSEAQRRYMHMHHPDIAERWEHHTTKRQKKRLPYHVSKLRLETSTVGAPGGTQYKQLRVTPHQQATYGQKQITEGAVTGAGLGGGSAGIASIYRSAAKGRVPRAANLKAVHSMAGGAVLGGVAGAELARRGVKRMRAAEAEDVGKAHWSDNLVTHHKKKIRNHKRAITRLSGSKNRALMAQHHAAIEHHQGQIDRLATFRSNQKGFTKMDTLDAFGIDRPDLAVTKAWNKSTKQEAASGAGLMAAGAGSIGAAPTMNQAASVRLHNAGVHIGQAKEAKVRGLAARGAVARGAHLGAAVSHAEKAKGLVQTGAALRSGARGATVGGALLAGTGAGMLAHAKTRSKLARPD